LPVSSSARGAQSCSHRVAQRLVDEFIARAGRTFRYGAARASALAREMAGEALPAAA
jgi:hypothetical protein